MQIWNLKKIISCRFLQLCRSETWRKWSVLDLLRLWRSQTWRRWSVVEFWPLQIWNLKKINSGIIIFFWDGVDPRPKEDDQLGIFKMVQIWNLQNCYTIRWSPGQILGWGNCNTTLRGPRRRLHHLMFRVLTTWAAEASLHTWVLTVEKVVPSQELPILCIWDIQSSHELLSNPHTPGL